MGTDKALLSIGSEHHTLAERTGELLSAAVAPFPALEVGPGRSHLGVVEEAQPGGGPLVAVLAGRKALESLGHAGSVLVLATDLPLLTAELLEWLTSRPGTASVVPVVGGYEQPLCARWSPAAFERAAGLAAAGERSLRLVFEPGAWRAGPADWEAVASESTFVDADRPEDLDALRAQSP